MTDDVSQSEHSARLNISYTLTDEGRSLWGLEDRLFLLKKKGEAMQTAVLKLLSYWLYFEEGLEIDRDVDGQTFRPDVVKVVDNDNIALWIDCGQTNMRKLEKIVTKTKNRETEFVIVKPDESSLRKYRREAVKKIPSERVTYVTFSDDFVNQLAGALSSRHTMSVVVSDTTLYVDVDNASFQCEILKYDGIE